MKRILLIDDDLRVTRFLRRVLQYAGHQVLTAVTGRDAMRLLAENQFDLVLTDIIMRDMEGIEIIMRVRREHQSLPIIAISGGGRISAEDHLLIARKLGANVTLAKPFTPAVLLAAVERVFAPHGQEDFPAVAAPVV